MQIQSRSFAYFFREYFQLLFMFGQSILSFGRMIHSHSQSEDISDDVDLQLKSRRELCFENYVVVYLYIKSKVLQKMECWTSIIQKLSKHKEGFRSTYVLNFLANIREKDSQYRLQRIQEGLTIQEIVEMFRLEFDRILSQENNEYQIISQYNCKMFKKFNRLNQFTEPLLTPERLIGLDIYACLHEINYICQHSQRSIMRSITSTLMGEITRIKVIKNLEKTLKIKWEQNFSFLDRDMTQNSFGMLSKILLLVHLKRKLTIFQSKNLTLQLDDKDLTTYQLQLPQQKYTFRGSHRFKYKFCELATYNPKEKELAKHNSLAKADISRKIEMILERSLQYNQSLELRSLMLQYKVTFKVLSEWINRLIGVTFPKPQEIIQMLERCQWNLLKYDTIDVLSKNPRDSKDFLSSQNFIGESICKIALERFRQYATVLKIQNRLMKKIEKGTSLYFKRFKYSYKKYYYIHHKDISGSTCASLQKQKHGQSPKEKNDSKVQQDNLSNEYAHEAQDDKQQKQVEQRKQKKKINAKDLQKSKDNSKVSLFTTLILGFSEDRDQFAFKYNEQLQDGYYIQHLVNFLKGKHGPTYNVFLSEVDLERNNITENIFVKMIELFKGKLHNFVKFEECPTKYFYHLLVHTYVDKCLSETYFESEDQFSDIISSATLQIIRLINDYIDAEVRQNKSKDYCYGPQEQSYEQSDDAALVATSQQKVQNENLIDQNYLRYDEIKICLKIQNILSNKMSIDDSSLDETSWQGTKSYTKKGITCQYYLKQQNKVRLSVNRGNLSNAPLYQALKQEIRDVQTRILRILEKKWPFLTDLQIKNNIEDFVPFLKEFDIGVKELKTLFRNITRSLIIYHAYFNELFCSKSLQQKVLKERYRKEISFLQEFYNKQLENTDKALPGMALKIYQKILNEFVRFPITSKKLVYYCSSKKTNKIKPNLKVQYKEEDCPKPFTRLPFKGGLFEREQ